jgi:hypothetical protein
MGIGSMDFGAPSPSFSTTPRKPKSRYPSKWWGDSATTQFRLRESDLIQFLVQPIYEAIRPTAVVTLQVEGEEQ